MGKSIIFIADFFYPELVGGAELNDFSLIKRMESYRSDKIKKISSRDVDMSFVVSNKDSKFIISNFVIEEVSAPFDVPLVVISYAPL